MQQRSYIPIKTYIVLVILLTSVYPRKHRHAGFDWLCFTAHICCMSNNQDVYVMPGQLQPLLFASISSLIQAVLSLYLVDWVKKR
jgi:hypothetical protein